VPEGLIREHGAVSSQVAASMARGVCEAMDARMGVSTTGIAGPTGGSARKPVGLLYIGVCVDGETAVRELKLGGGRKRIRDRAAKHALHLARLALIEGVSAVAEGT
jgi:nicotinamide-nucleotide amidase